MPNRKKSYISRKLPPVARSTAPIFDCGAAESGREAEVVASSMRGSPSRRRDLTSVAACVGDGVDAQLRRIDQRQQPASVAERPRRRAPRLSRWLSAAIPGVLFG